MTSRDDYPAIAVHARYPGAEGRQCYDALEEIDRLRAELERWKERAEQYRQDYWQERAWRTRIGPR